MGIQHFMQEYIARRMNESPSEAFVDPQVELFTEISRQADLEERVAQIGETGGTEDEGRARESEPAAEESFPEGESPAEETPDAEVAEPAESEQLEPVVARHSESHTASAVPDFPVPSSTEDAEPEPVFTEETPPAEPEAVSPVDMTEPAQPSEPVEESTKGATVTLPPAEFTENARVSPVLQAGELPIPVVEINGDDSAQSLIPESLPFDFNEMLDRAQDQAARQPTGYSVRGGDSGLLVDLPDFDPLHVAPSTDFAESKIQALSAFWKQGERRI